MSDLTREKFTEGGDPCWAVKNKAGAAEFRYVPPRDGLAEVLLPAIWLHSPEKRPYWGSSDCQLLPGGHCWDNAWSGEGRALYDAWFAGGCDDEVIWRALENWHAEYFDAEPMARTERADYTEG